MKIIEVIKIKQYFAIAVVIAFIFSSIYVYTQVLGIVANIDVWLSNIPLENAILFIIFSALFGVTMSFQIYNWKQQPKVCAISGKATGGGVSGAATFIGLMVAQCPACASFGTLFLPVSAIVFIGQNTLIINLLSIGLLLFTINYLGGFNKVSEKSNETGE